MERKNHNKRNNKVQIIGKCAYNFFFESNGSGSITAYLITNVNFGFYIGIFAFLFFLSNHKIYFSGKTVIYGKLKKLTTLGLQIILENYNISKNNFLKYTIAYATILKEKTVPLSVNTCLKELFAKDKKREKIANMKRGIQPPTVRIHQPIVRLNAPEKPNGEEMIGDSMTNVRKLTMENQENRPPFNEAGNQLSVSENAKEINTSDSLLKVKSNPNCQIDINMFQQLDSRQVENAQLSATCNELKEKLELYNKETEAKGVEIVTLNDQIKSLQNELSNLHLLKEKESKELNTAVQTLTDNVNEFFFIII
ncbi:SMCs flexible hinge domain protein [Reticulomyxa filosa]|uniref:SMCs flexible hinge domain protein n=1 Tax=Reticulomyxa filosa TaxID=46433 RepID=X6P7F4_RETFI|nr:SMCs flexible hinge domain protein [Reticulomyxa filosa]|eukprot:ETO34053.1 SMCs flexible hinge domain protein [Reticulomyxa filosa]